MITVVIPTIPTRGALLGQALGSVHVQTLRPDDLIIETDWEHAGAPATRHKALMKVKTPWVAFLDDDDLFMPQHLEKLMNFANETQADYVYSWFETIPAGGDPFPPSHFLDPWNKNEPRHTTVTTLVRTSLAQEVGFAPHPDANDQWPGEDWHFTLRCNELGIIEHLVERTWYWRHHGYGTPGIPGNTSGLGSRW